ncbi:MAG: ABC transporter substrate-binding protein [Thermomicrobiales bacterium]
MLKFARRFRSLLAIVAALLLVSGLAVPYASALPSSQSGDPIELTFWNYWDGTNGEVMQSLVDEWNAANPDVQVENIFIGFNDLLPKLQAATAGGDAPDIAAGDLIWMPKLAQSGAIAPLDDLAATAGIDLTDFYPALLNAGSYDGKTYGLPVSTNNLELFYNKELFEKAGLDPNKPPTTWDELREMAKQCANPDEGIAGMELFTEPGEGLTWQYQVYLWQSGGEFLTDDLSAAAFNSDAGKQSLQFWTDLLNVDKSAPLTTWGQFGQGTSCMAMDGSWMVGIWAADPPFDLGTAVMPIPTGGQQATNMGGEQLVIFSKDAEKQAAAAKFMAWLTSTETQISWDQQTGFTPIRESVATSTEYLDWVNTSQPLLLPFVEQQVNAHNRPAVTNYPEISDAFSRELERALLGKATVDEALAAAEKAVNDLLSGN